MPDNREVTWHRWPATRARDLAVRRVRSATVVTGIGSVVGAGALAVAVANSDPAAWSATPTAAVPKAHHHRHGHRRHKAPHSLVATKRVHRHRASVPRVTAQPVQPAATHSAAPVVVAAKPKPKPAATRTSAPPPPPPSPSPTATTSGGSQG